MRMGLTALAFAIAAAICTPSMAQTALPGQAPAATTMPPTMTKPMKPPAPAKPMAAATALPTAAAAVGKVNVNTATEAQLDAIPQIGPKRASSIIKNRPYKSVDELVSKKALPAGIFEKIKGHLSV